ncbi:MAG TPA: PASTA domain-containing protein [Acidobacteriaceae bacterium]|nr:PASTA domain-containing protein [Acidobacteriaceae bacterium]
MKGVRFKLRPVQNFFEGALLLMGLVVVALLSAITTMHFAIHGAEVHVPVLKGMTVAEARSQTAGLGLNLDVDNRYYSSDVAAGHILSQSPAPNAIVRREWRVRVAESLGPQKVEVPAVVGREERTASLNLRRVGLEAGTIAHLPWPGPASEIGVILAQDPPARAQGIERPAVNLLVAAPDDTRPDGFVMPDLTGLPVVSAQTAVARVGLKPGEPRFQDVAIPSVSTVGSASSTPSTAPQAPTAPRPTVLPGTVLSQTPPAGYRVDVGATVVFTVAK